MDAARPSPDAAATADPAASKAALLRDPADAGARLALADRLAAAGDTAAALTQTRLALAALRADAPPSAPALDRRQARAALALAEALDAAGDAAGAARQRARVRTAAAPLAAGVLAEARQALDAGDADTARRGCTLALALAPDAPQGQVLAAALAAAGAGIDRRVGHLAAAAGLAPSDARARLRLGVRLRALGEVAAAAAALRGALRLDPDLYDAWRTLGAILRDEGHLAAALPLARHLRSLRPDDPRGLVLLGQLLANLGEAQEAAEALREALALEPDWPAARALLADALDRLGRHDETVEVWRGAVRQAPEDADALRTLAETLTRLGHHAEAVVWYRRAVALRPDSRTLNRSLGQALLHREHWAAAVPALRRAMPRGRPYGLPPWDGEAATPLLLHHARADGPETLLFGLGLAARAGLGTVCAVPLQAVALARRALPAARMAALSNEAAVTAAAAEHGAAAQIRFRDLPALLCGDGAEALPAWLAPPSGSAGAPRRGWALAPATGPEAPPAVAWDSLAAMLGPETVRLDPTARLDRLAEALAGVEGVLCGDGPVAHLAGAMGLPGVVLLPPGAPWWWGDRPDTCAWYPSLTLVRARTPEAWAEALEQLHGVLAARRPAAAVPPPLPRPADGDQALAETLDRLAAHLGPLTGPLACTPLPGGDGRLVRVAAPAGDRLLRLPRFPDGGGDAIAAEIRVLRRAAAVGAAPEVFYGDDLDGTLLTAAPEGPALTHRDLRQPEMAAAAAALYRRLHGAGRFRGRYDPFARLRRLTRRLERAESEPLRQAAEVRAVMDRARRALAADGAPSASCHNQPVPARLHGTAAGLVLTDWTAAARSDPHWEVGALSARADMPQEVAEAFFAAYLGDADHPAMARPALFAALTCWERWLMAVEARAETPDDADADAAVERWWGRLTRRLEAEDFAARLEAVRRGQAVPRT